MGKVATGWTEAVPVFLLVLAGHLKFLQNAANHAGYIIRTHGPGEGPGGSSENQRSDKTGDFAARRATLFARAA
jgi:hypothetical protein